MDETLRERRVAAGWVCCEDGLWRPGWAAVDVMLRDYYDNEWGRPVRDEQGMFERISLEGFQSGLSWATILRKREAFREVFCGFDPDVVAGFGEADVARLMQDVRIVRNRRKIEATVAMRAEVGLADFVWSFVPKERAAAGLLGAGTSEPTTSVESVALSKALKARGFSFVGPTTLYALMLAVGMVSDWANEGSRWDV